MNATPRCLRRLFPSIVFFGFSSLLLAADPITPEFSAWQTEGNVSTDDIQKRDAAPSIKLEPGSKAVLRFPEEGGGEVTFWTWDDGTASQPGKERHTGPRWGLLDGQGNELLIGVLYAPYLQEGGSYTLSEKKNPTVIKYLGGREPGKWQKWTLRFDPEAGGRLLINDKPADNRWNWDESQFPAFNGIVLYGDTPGGAKAQDFWVEVAYTTVGPMKAQPVPPPPPAPVVPDADPQAEGTIPKFRPGLLEQHPRVLFTQADVAKIREFYESPSGAPWRAQLDAYAAASTPPASAAQAKFLTDATDGQRHGLWRLPTVALHYLLTGNATSKERVLTYLRILLELPSWETGSEKDAGMSSANIMIGAALAFDWLYNELDPEFREKFRQKLWYQARAQYYGGHLNRNNSMGYWQGDTHNNHRWHRNAGMTLAVLAAYTGDPSQDWFLKTTLDELEYVAKWLPEDGTSHEGPGYLIFGGNHLALGFDAVDHCLGTDLLQEPFFKNIGYFRILSMTSGLKTPLAFGDNAPRGLGSYGNFLLLGAVANQQPEVAAMLRELVKRTPGLMEYGWFSLIWDRPDWGNGSTANFPTIGYFPDVGVAYLHDSWSDEGVSAMFKSSPFGGFKLNEFRTKPDGKFQYVNVAHDDPDANSFIIAKGNNLLAQTDGYSSQKRSQNHNTILINGMGQMAAGRPEGGGWAQPSAGDMSKMAFITGWLQSGAVVGVEGEAAGSYLAYTDKKTGTSRPALERFRRSFFWVKGDYILVLDDVRAASPVEVTWLVQGEKLTESAPGRYVLEAEGDQCPVQLVADSEFTAKIGPSPADDRGKALGWQQLQATSAPVPRIRFASVANPWGREDLTVTLTAKSPDEAVVTVRSKDFTDEWTWRAAEGERTPSLIQAKRVQGKAPEGFPLDFSRATQPAVNGAPVLAGGK